MSISVWNTKTIWAQCQSGYITQGLYFVTIFNFRGMIQFLTIILYPVLEKAVQIWKMLDWNYNFDSSSMINVHYKLTLG